MGLFDLFSKKNKTVDLEKQRCERLAKIGRITEGRITDSEQTDAGELVFYVYSVQGADFESSELLDEGKLAKPLKYAPGAKVGVRYDPKQHGNSMLV